MLTSGRGCLFARRDWCVNKQKCRFSVRNLIIGGKIGVLKCRSLFPRVRRPVIYRRGRCVNKQMRRFVCWKFVIW